ncbi:MAG TPA: hypothetical protein QGF58_04560 [Myxococcota bacterium]|nr:hypothetical protein [Myxococcota bacterium]
MTVLLLSGIALAGPLDKPREPIAGRVQYQPYIDPVANLSVFRVNGTPVLGFNIGLEAGVTYADLQTILAGKSRTRGTLLLGGGYDVRAGTFVGPVTEYWSVLGGGDVFYNEYRFVGLPASPGIDFPIVATVGPQEIYALGGITTTWLANPARRVDWDRNQYFGVGHEFEYRLGMMVTAGRFHFGLSWSRRIMATGPNDGFGLTLGF